MLDDATSSLDTVTEHQVERALARDVRHGTRLIVAHRLSSAARCDLVVWLEEGRVRATGTHEALWRSEEYRALFAPPEATEPAAPDLAPAAASPTDPYPHAAVPGPTAAERADR